MKMLKIKIQPRVQTEIFSMYWKEPLSTETKTLPAFHMDEFPPNESVQALLVRVAEKLDWQSVETLQRLDGFTEPWERVLYEGK